MSISAPGCCSWVTAFRLSGGAPREKLPLPPKAGPVKAKAAAPKVSPSEKAPAPAQTSPVPPTVTSNPRYFYVDRQGELHFVDRIEEVPVAFRKDAQRLEK